MSTRAEFRPPEPAPVENEVHLIMSRHAAEYLRQVLSCQHTGEFYQALVKLLGK